LSDVTGSIPEEISVLTNLEEISFLQMANLTGTISGGFGSLYKLSRLTFSGLNLTGTIPGEIKNLKFLTQLTIYDTAIQGELPTVLSNWTGLSDLNLAMNSLAGTIPNSFTELTNLVNLRLDGQSLFGAIPSGFNALTALLSLNLSGNSHTGSLASADFASMTTLQLLDLSSNSFSGTLPDDFSFMTNLYHLSLGDQRSAQRLSGTLPSGYSELSMLIHLDLSKNEFNGTIPGAWFLDPPSESLRQLSYLDLQSNRFTGALPSISVLTNLMHLNLAGKADDESAILSTIPVAISLVTTLTYLNLGMQGLTGQIPDSLSKLTGLRHLDLSGKSNAWDLDGNIPLGISELQLLSHLDLRSQKFSGYPPIGFTTLESLQYLDLSQNQFTGSLTGAFWGWLSSSYDTNFPSLATVLLNDNLLTGTHLECPFSALSTFNVDNNNVTKVQILTLRCKEPPSLLDFFRSLYYYLLIFTPLKRQITHHSFKSLRNKSIVSATIFPVQMEFLVSQQNIQFAPNRYSSCHPRTFQKRFPRSCTVNLLHWHMVQYMATIPFMCCMPTRPEE
jgi:Leucine-rich repeat (LRR) protein